jgi:hypothetical protein
MNINRLFTPPQVYKLTIGSVMTSILSFVLCSTSKPIRLNNVGRNVSTERNQCFGSDYRAMSRLLMLLLLLFSISFLSGELVVTVDHPYPNGDGDFSNIADAVDYVLSQSIENEARIVIYGQEYHLQEPIDVDMRSSSVEHLKIESAYGADNCIIHGASTGNNRTIWIHGDRNDTLEVRNLSFYQEGSFCSVIEGLTSDSSNTYGVLGTLKFIGNQVTTSGPVMMFNYIIGYRYTTFELFFEDNTVHTIHSTGMGYAKAKIDIYLNATPSSRISTHIKNNTFNSVYKPISIQANRIDADICNNEFIGNVFSSSMNYVNSIMISPLSSIGQLQLEPSVRFIGNKMRNVKLYINLLSCEISDNVFSATVQDCYALGFIELDNTDGGNTIPTTIWAKVDSNIFYGFSFVNGFGPVGCVYLYEEEYILGYGHGTGIIDLAMNNNAFLCSDAALVIERGDNLPHRYSHIISSFRNNFISVDNDPLMYHILPNAVIDSLRTVQIENCFFENGYPTDDEHFIVDFIGCMTGDPQINLQLDLNNADVDYSLIWDETVKSPLINTGCPEIDGVSQSDPDGTPPDIGARYYPHHHRKYFDRTDGSGIYWLSFPVLDDKSYTNGTNWNELGFMFNEYMDEEYQALNQIHWSYDTDVDDMSYDPGSLEWENTNHTAEQPKGYKVKFNPELNYDPLLVNGFKADPVTTPVAWVEEYLHNGQMQDFPNMIGYFVPDTQDAGYALSRNLPGSSRFTYLDFVHTIKTRNWSTYRISEEMYSPWIIDPDTYTLSEGDMVELLLLPGAPEEMYWNTGLHVAPRERPRATAFSYEEKLDYTSLIIEFDPDDLPREVGVYIDGECKGASVVDSSVVDICVYPDEAKSGGEASIVFYYEGKGAKAAQGWKLYNPKSMVFEDGTLSLSAKDKYSYISFKHKAGDSPVPLVTALHQNYPNPFNPDTNISFILGSDMPVILDVFNIKGQKVKRLCDRELPRGQHSIQWNGRDANNRPVASGMYFYRLSSPEGVQTRKMMLMK